MQPSTLPDGGYHARSARVSPHGSGSSVVDDDSVHGLTSDEGLVHAVSLRFLSPRVEVLYLLHIGADRSSSLGADVGLYLLLSALTLTGFVSGLLQSEVGTEPLQYLPAIVVMSTWACMALLMFIALCLPARACAAPIGPVALGAGFLVLMVPAVVALHFWHEADASPTVVVSNGSAPVPVVGVVTSPTPTALTHETAHATIAQAVLLCLASLPGAVLTLPLRWAAPPVLLASTAFCVVLALGATLPPVELATRIIATLVLTLLVLTTQRRHELLFRLQFFRALEEDTGGGGGARDSLRRTSASPFRTSFTKADALSGTNRTITPSTDMVEALTQLRQLRTTTGGSASGIKGRRGQALNKRIGKTIELLESSIVTAPGTGGGSTNFDWQHEIAAAGVDDTVGEWLMSTLASAQQRQVGGGAGTATNQDSFDVRRVGSAELSPTPGGSSFGPSVLSRAMTDLSFSMGRRSSEEVIDAAGLDERRTRRSSETKNLKDSISQLGAKVASPFRRPNSKEAMDGDKDPPSGNSFDDKVKNSRARRSSEEMDTPGTSMSDVLEAEVQRLTPKGKLMAEAALRDWGADVVEINRATEGHALYFIAMAVLERHNLINACRIDRATLSAFLLRIERKYGSNEYHNSMHGCDVMLHTHLFLTRFGYASRLSHVQLLAAFIGALIHDFNHPGTTNAHETKMQSLLALTYSDQSVLERHHLASAFAVLKTKGYDILSGLSLEDYRIVRTLIIEFVLATDLTTHFDFIVRLKTLAATRGHMAHTHLQMAAASAATHSSSHKRGSCMEEPLRQRRGSIDLTNLGRRASCETSQVSAPLPAITPKRVERRKSNTPEPAVQHTSAEQRRGSCGADLRQASSEQRRGSSSAFNQARRGSKQPDLEQGESGKFVPKQWHSPFSDEEVDVRLLLTTAVKFADLNHAAKPLQLHRDWSQRITTEFWVLGDKERRLGVPMSPLCDRVADANIAKSQVGFFQFVCLPFFEQVADLVDPDMMPFHSLKQNFQSWRDQAAAQATAASSGTPA